MTAKGKIVVVGLGPGSPQLASAEALERLRRCEHRYLRTRRHPSAELAEPARSFDSMYEESNDLGQVYETIVETLFREARLYGEIVYAVPGSPTVAERTVVLLRDRAAGEEVTVELVPSLSFVDLAWDRLQIDPVEVGVRIVDGYRFAEQVAGYSGPVLVTQCDSKMVLSDIKLSLDTETLPDVVVLQRLGCVDEQVFTVSWPDLDRSFEPDHLTSLWIPGSKEAPGSSLVALEELVRTLRERCPWDREQTHQSITRHLLEEAYEVLDAIAAIETKGEEAADELEEELGDLLFQVFFHSVLAAEKGWFTLADIARRLHAKLVARHPHVFGDVEVSDAREVRANWEEIKKAEKGRSSVMDGIPTGLPALAFAAKVHRKAASSGLDFPSKEAVFDKIVEELQELRRNPGPEELGDLLFAVSTAGVHMEIEPETALRSAVHKFVERFRRAERLAVARGIDLRSLDAVGWNSLWEEAKRAS